VECSGAAFAGGWVVIVSCPSCQARYQYDESRFGDTSTKRLKCSKCNNVFEVSRPSILGGQIGQTTFVGGKKPEETTKQFDVGAMASPEEEASLPQLSPLPVNRRYSLAVILGANAGHIYSILKPRAVMGRGQGCDIQLQDSEVSRRHAMIEVRGEDAMLVDLQSTNGTFVEGVRIQRAPLPSHQEFSLGTTTLMFIVTEVGEAS